MTSGQVMGILQKIVISVLIVFGILFVAKQITTKNTEVELQQIDVRIKQSEIDQLKRKIDELDKNKETNTELLKELKEQNKRLQTIKDEKARTAAENASNAVFAQEQVDASPTLVQTNSSCMDWINAAGITDTANAYELIMRESSCNPNAINPSSGACGLGQQLPCGKWANTWNEPIGALQDMQGYVIARYGSWAAAIDFHDKMNWY